MCPLFLFKTITMKTIELRPVEYISNFTKIAKFAFEAYVLNGFIHVTANIEQLKTLGY